MRGTRDAIGLSNLFYFSIMLFLLAGCAATMSTFAKGGTVVPKDYEIQKEIVAYRAYGNVPADVQYYLVETSEGLAIFEHKIGDYGYLHQAHWQDNEGDHFASWVIPFPGFSTIVIRPIQSLSGCCGPAYEFVVPFDRSKEAKMYRYPKQTYTIKKINWIKRPVPKDPETKPDGRLIPK
jgi:hypothetical protein